MIIILILWFGLNIFISENNIHGNYNSVIYINIIGLERKQYSLFGSSPKFYGFSCPHCFLFCSVFLFCNLNRKCVTIDVTAVFN